MPLYIVCGVFDIVFFSVQNYCNQDICNRIYTSLRHDAHNTLYLLFLRMYILQKYMVSFFCIHVSFWLSLLYWWLLYRYFYYPAFCFYHCRLQILLLLVFCCNSMASHSKQRLLLYNSDAAKPSFTLFLIIIWIYAKLSIVDWIALSVIRGFCQNFSPDLVLILP